MSSPVALSKTNPGVVANRTAGGPGLIAFYQLSAIPE